MLLYNFDYLYPSITDIAMYSQFLANSYPSPATIKNHLSGVKSWINLHGGSSEAIMSQELNMMCKSIADKSNHTPSPATPISPQDIIKICLYIDQHQPQPLAIKPAILIAYATFLRVSNVLSPSRITPCGPHTLRAQDIVQTNAGLKVIVRSTKTKRGGRHTY